MSCSISSTTTTKSLRVVDENENDTFHDAVSEMPTPSTVSEEFRHRVLRLCCGKWPFSADDCFKISHLPGGTFNRIMGITYTDPVTAASEEYVLRIPRFGSALVDFELAALMFAARKTDIPVPEVVAFDLTSRNSLCTPYSIQTRIPGRPLNQLYGKLNLVQKKSAAKAMADLITKLHSKKYDRPGRVDPYQMLHGAYEPETLKYKGPSRADQRIPAIPLTPYGLLVEHLECWKSVRASQWSSDNPIQLNQLIRMAAQMEKLGLFVDSTNTFCHLDLEPRNILASVVSETEVQIEGVVDWDTAVFAPRFVGCKAPSWLWRWGSNVYDEADERNANKPLADLHSCELKKTFEDAMDREFLRFAYSREFQIARKLFCYATEGIQASNIYREAEDILSEWHDLYQEWMNVYDQAIGIFEDDEETNANAVDEMPLQGTIVAELEVNGELKTWRDSFSCFVM